MKKVLVTGGAGFIGQHLVRALLDAGHTVRVYDSFEPQVHGSQRRLPKPLDGAVDLQIGDVQDRTSLAAALEGMEIVFHQAARVGVGQSMYEIASYTAANTLGTATLLQLLAEGHHRVEKLLVASSMSIYGEGAYRCPRCGPVDPPLRSEEQLRQRLWELLCPQCGITMEPLPTPETKRIYPTSVYAVSKRDQEELCLAVGRAYGLPTVALRYFNAYGPGQALSNPYTGVAAIFSCRLLNGQPPVLYEDGRQSRDFTHVRDIVQANLLAMESARADYQTFNVGTGSPTDLLTLGQLLAHHLQRAFEPEVKHAFRQGDIRHCFADISRIHDALGFEPSVSLNEGIGDLVAWVEQQTGIDRFLEAESALVRHRLTI